MTSIKPPNAGEAPRPPQQIARVPGRLHFLLPAFCAIFCSAAFAGDQSSLVGEGPADGVAFNCVRARTTGGDIVIVNTTLAGVPAILRMPKRITKPPIILWHGFGAPASEDALMGALPLDDLPAVKVYLGLPLFGARAPAGGTQELVQRQTRDFASLIFKPTVVGAADELPAVIAALVRDQCMAPGDKIGLFGFSGGGAAALLVLAQGKVAVSAAIALNASTGLSASIEAMQRVTKQKYQWSPGARKLASNTDAARHAAQIARGSPPPALLLVQGLDDTVLTPQPAIDLNEALRPYYIGPANENRLKLSLVAGMPHTWSDGDRAAGELRQTFSDWFAGYM